jgi:hypothetical protein
MLEQIEQTNSSPPFPDPSTLINNPTNSSSNPTISSKSSSRFKKESMLDQLIKNCKSKKRQRIKKRESEKMRVVKRNKQHQLHLTLFADLNWYGLP